MNELCLLSLNGEIALSFSSFVYCVFLVFTVVNLIIYLSSGGVDDVR